MSMKQKLAYSGPLTPTAYLTRKSDDKYLDLNDMTFKLTGFTTKTLALVQSTVNPTSWNYYLPTTPVAVFVDDAYTIELDVGGPQNITFNMVNGDDTILQLDIPFGFVASVAGDGTSVVIYGGNLPTIGVASGDYSGKTLRLVGAGPFGYSTPILGAPVHTFTPAISSSTMIGGVPVATHTFAFTAPNVARASAIPGAAKVALL